MNHLPYELALELKQHGFPQPERIAQHNHLLPPEAKETKLNSDVVTGINYNLAVYDPTLSELIDECGTRFGCLSNNGSFWQANHSTDSIEGTGPTPEIAVAELYKKLNPLKV
jgi:hypothetical protein